MPTLCVRCGGRIDARTRRAGGELCWSCSTEDPMWYLAVNTFTPGRPTGYTVISSHRTVEAAARACRASQPRERGSYLSVGIRVADRRRTRGEIIGPLEYPIYKGDWYC